MAEIYTHTTWSVFCEDGDCAEHPYDSDPVDSLEEAESVLADHMVEAHGEE